MYYIIMNNLIILFQNIGELVCETTGLLSLYIA